MRRFKLPKLNHPWAKSAAGFTLVELIVVIAIMGVLAGTGTVGYSGYVKKSKQKADQVLVSNVIRAVDVGIQTSAYTLEDVMQIELDNNSTMTQAGLQLPVGFVIMDTEGTRVLTATNSETTTIGKDCEFVNISTWLASHNVFDENAAGNTSASNRYAIQTPVVKTRDCGGFLGAGTHDVYEIKNMGEYTYMAPEYCTSLVSKLSGEEICVTHSVLKTKTIHTGKKTATVRIGCDGWLHSEIPGSYTTGTGTETVIDFNASKFVCCDENSQVKFETYGDNYTAGTDTEQSSMLSQSLNAAFGDYTQLKLQSTDWVEVSSIPTFYSNASGMFEDVENLANLLQGITTMDVDNYMRVADLTGTGTGLHVYANVLGIQIDKTATITQDTHDSSSDLVYDIASKIVTTYTDEDAFIANAWNDIDANRYPYDQEGFGIGGREYYLSARTSYNLGFSEYVGSQCAEHASQIKDFGQPAVDMVLEEIGMAGNATMTNVMNGIIGDLVPDADVSSAIMPYCVQASVFDSTAKHGDAYLHNQYDAEGNKTADGLFDKMGYTFHSCPTCKSLYEQYKTSGTCEENGRAFYQMMATAAQTPENLVNGSNTDADFFDYYNGYVDAFGELYRQAQSAAQNGAVVISVYMNAGEMDYAVSPNTLDTRKQD